MDVNLVLLKKKGSRKIFPLPSDVTVIGRRSNCDLYIPLTSVSRRHCELNRHEGVLKIRDLGSRNGTHLNGERIDEAVIKAGDSVKVGPLTFVFQIDGQPKNVNTTGSAMKKSSQKGTPIGDSGVEDSDIFAELGKLDEMDEQDDFDFLEDSGSG